MIANNPTTRMLAFDSMDSEERRLANEYGVNVVRQYRHLGAPDLEAACRAHRAQKQVETLSVTAGIGRAMALKLRRMAGAPRAAHTGQAPVYFAGPSGFNVLDGVSARPVAEGPDPSLWGRLRRLLA